MHVLCWDIDLTLLTTARAGVFAWEEALVEVGAAAQDLAQLRTAGLTDAAIAGELLEQVGHDATDESVATLLRAYERRLPDRLHLREGRVLEGVREVLDDLASREDVLLLLLTGNTRAGAHAKLAHYGLDHYFDDGAFCDDRSPRSDIAIRARALAERRLGDRFDPDRFYVIGDTPHDVECGKAAGARTVAVATGVHSRAELEACDPWLVLDELPQPTEFGAMLGITPP
jgi:phosphoglycolate phosphatase-like HAD superfamily hydrolase